MCCFLDNIVVFIIVFYVIVGFGVWWVDINICLLVRETVLRLKVVNVRVIIVGDVYVNKIVLVVYLLMIDYFDFNGIDELMLILYVVVFGVFFMAELALSNYDIE